MVTKSQLKKGDKLRLLRKLEYVKKSVGDIIEVYDVYYSYETSWLFCDTEYAYYSKDEDAFELIETKPPHVFKVGDKVKIIQRKSDNHTGFCNYFEKNGDVGKIGYILEVYNRDSYSVFPDSSREGLYFGCFDYDDLELIEESKDIIKDNVVSVATVKKSGKNIMDKFIKFAKNALLSPDEKLLRKHGFKTECGDYTDEAQAFAIRKLCEEKEAEMIKVATSIEEDNKKK